MGTLLAKPETDKETELGACDGMRAGVSSMQGWRVDMEDAHIMEMAVPGAPDHAFFGVLDGHGGDFAAKFASKRLLATVCEQPAWKEYLSGGKVDALKQALRGGFLAMDAELRATDNVRQQQDRSGCTCVTCMVTPTHLVAANAGDSRLVLRLVDKTEPLSFDHKPYDDKERLRIEAAGGCVSMKRVDGDLAVSRALGDFQYKDSDSLPAEQQKVTALPDIISRPRSGNDRYLVIACDGIWDVLSNDASTAFVDDLVADTGESDMGLVAEEMLDHCLRLDSRDNMTAMVVAFDGFAEAKTGKGVSGLREERKLAAERSAAAAAAGAGEEQQ